MIEVFLPGVTKGVMTKFSVQLAGRANQILISWPTLPDEERPAEPPPPRATPADGTGTKSGMNSCSRRTFALIALEPPLQVDFTCL